MHLVQFPASQPKCTQNKIKCTTQLTRVYVGTRQAGKSLKKVEAPAPAPAPAVSSVSSAMAAAQGGPMGGGGGGGKVYSSSTDDDTGTAAIFIFH